MRDDSLNDWINFWGAGHATDSPQASTIDIGDDDLAIVAAKIDGMQYVGSVCGSCWCGREFKYLDPSSRRERTQNFRHELQIKQLAFDVRKADGFPPLADIVPVLARPFLAPSETPPDSETFWSSLWSGPELIEINTVEQLRKEFWESFMQSAWSVWRSSREAARVARLKATQPQ